LKEKGKKRKEKKKRKKKRNVAGLRRWVIELWNKSEIL